MGGISVFLTTYGFRELETSSIHGSAVQYLVANHVIPAGTEWDGNRKLAKPVRWRRGTILTPRLLKTDDPKKRTIVWAAFPYGIYEALRALMHTKHGYRGVDDEQPGVKEQSGEVQKLEGVRDALDVVLGSLALRPALTRLQREAILTFIRRGAATIGGVRDPAKLRALGHMRDAAREQDTKGRRNPSARMAIVVGAENDLRDRLDLIRFIEPRIGAREIALAREAVRIRRVFGHAYHAAEETRNGIAMRNRFMWLARLDLVRNELASIQVGPYPAHVEKLDRDLHKSQTALKKGDIIGARKKLGVVMESLRCKKARWLLEELIVRLSLFARQRDPDSDIAAQFAREIQQFSERIVARIDDTGFEKPVRGPACGLLGAAVSMITAKESSFSLPTRMRSAKGFVEGAARRL